MGWGIKMFHEISFQIFQSRPPVTSFSTGLCGIPPRPSTQVFNFVFELRPKPGQALPVVKRVFPNAEAGAQRVAGKPRWRG